MKVLVIRFSSIGDILLTTPVLRCLKRQLNAEVHFLTKGGNVELLYNNANVDKVVVLQDSMRQTVSALKKESYDAVVDLHNNHRSRYVRRRLRVKSYVYRKENVSKWLTIMTKHSFMSGLHVVDRYLKAVAPLGVKDDGGGLEINLPEELKSDALKLKNISGKNVSDLTGVPYVVIACGAQHATKRIPLEKIMVVSSLIRAKVVLLGDKTDKTRIRNWEGSFGGNVVNLCGKTTLQESAALINGASAVVTPDSAMMHFAAALHRPVIAVWGATIPDFGFSAFRTWHVDCEVNNLWCRPCSRMGSGRCPLGHLNCMHNQNWQSIAEAASKMAENNGSQN